MKKKTVTFGESLLRLAPPGFERFLQSSGFGATFGGAEANVAVALSSFGMNSAYVTVLPDDNPIADAAIAEPRAISASAADLAMESMRQARAMGLTVSFDLNYRRNLWKWGKRADVVMKDMVQTADIVIGNEEHLQMVLGIEGPVEVKELTERALDSFENLKAVAISLRESQSASRHGWSAA